MSNTSLTVAIKHPNRSRLTAISALRECSLQRYELETIINHPEWREYHKEHVAHCDLPEMEILGPQDYSIQGNEEYINKHKPVWVHDLFKTDYLKFNESDNNS